MGKYLFREFLFAILFFALISRVYSQVPNSTTGKLAFNAIVNQESRGIIIVKSFEKTNGIMREVSGQPIYTLEYKSIVKFVKGGWKVRDIAMGYFHSFNVLNHEPKGWDIFGKECKYFNEDDEIELTGDIIYEKTEKGWRKLEHKSKSWKIVASRPDEQKVSIFLGNWRGNGIGIDIFKAGKETKAIFIDEKGKKERLNVSFDNENAMMILKGKIHIDTGLKNELYISVDENNYNSLWLWGGKGKGTGAVGIDRYQETEFVNISYICVPQIDSFFINQTLTAFERAKKGEDFTSLQKEYTTRFNDNNGNIGWFCRGQKIAIFILGLQGKNFEEAAFNTKVGEISDLVREGPYIFIIKINAKETRLAKI